MSNYFNEVLDWLEANAAAKKIERWFFFTTWKDIVNVGGDGYMGIIFFDGPGQGAFLNCLGETYRSRFPGPSTGQVRRFGQHSARGMTVSLGKSRPFVGTLRKRGGFEGGSDSAGGTESWGGVRTVERNQRFAETGVTRRVSSM